MTQPPDATRPVAPVPPAAPPPPPPGTGTQPMPPAPAGPADRTLLKHLGFGIAVVALTVVALAVKENGARGYAQWTAWSSVATVAAALHLLPVVWQGKPRLLWDVVAGATVVLAFFWVAAFLPFVTTGTGCAMTAAVAFAGVHLWLLPGRR